MSLYPTPTISLLITLPTTSLSAFPTHPPTYLSPLHTNLAHAPISHAPAHAHLTQVVPVHVLLVLL